MKVAVGSDHAGYALKEHIKDKLAELGHETVDLGAHSADLSDYPLFAAKVAEAVSRGEAERGVAVCGTGLGVAMAANRFRGVRAAPCESEFAAEMARRHNDANVLALGARLLTPERAERLLEVFLREPFDGGRHARRTALIEGVAGGCQRNEAARPDEDIKRDS